MAYIGNRVATSGTSIKADKSAPANSLRVKSNGNIGVGVAEPSSKLHVAGTVTATAFQGDGSALTGIESLPAAIDVNGSAPDDSLAIDSAGKVGIGTSSPATALDVAGTVTADGLTVASDSAYAIDVSRPSAGNTTLRITGGATAGNDAIFRADIGNTTGSSGIYFGDTATNGIGRIMYEHNGDYMRFYTSSTEKMRIDSAGDVLPGANGTQDFGSSSLRWANIYTSDLHLSNGIGNYTIVEGEEDLFLYNNKNGKTYKFMLAEVDPGEAPKKMEK